jgi:hypothetical protein
LRIVGHQPEPKLIAFMQIAKAAASSGSTTGGGHRAQLVARGLDQALPVSLDLALDDADVPRPFHHPGAGGADFVGKGN